MAMPAWNCTRAGSCPAASGIPALSRGPAQAGGSTQAPGWAPRRRRPVLCVRASLGDRAQQRRKRYFIAHALLCKGLLGLSWPAQPSCCTLNPWSCLQKHGHQFIHRIRHQFIHRIHHQLIRRNHHQLIYRISQPYTNALSSGLGKKEGEGEGKGKGKGKEEKERPPSLTFSFPTCIYPKASHDLQQQQGCDSWCMRRSAYRGAFMCDCFLKCWRASGVCVSLTSPKNCSSKLLECTGDLACIAPRGSPSRAQDRALGLHFPDF